MFSKLTLLMGDFISFEFVAMHSLPICIKNAIVILFNASHGCVKTKTIQFFAQQWERDLVKNLPNVSPPHP